MKKTRNAIENAVKDGAIIVVSRERVSIDGETIPRKVFEAMIDDGVIAFSHRPNNFTKAYKAVGRAA